jgi:protocatechuate 3,4-dioxygenase beta subunit
MNAERSASVGVERDDHDHHDHHDLFVAKLTRRDALGAFAAIGLGVLAACGDGDKGSSAITAAPTETSAPPGTSATAGTTAAPAPSNAATATTAATAGEYLDFPEETNGPFPADGSNDNGSGELADVLADSRIVRTDITANLDGSDQQHGIPMALTMMVGSAGAPLKGAAVYVWHCSRDGHYSVYNGGMNGGDYSDSTWFRGVQVTDTAGAVTFETIFPGRYSGRATHIHFEVYADDTYSDLLLTSQIGFDDDDADAVYATDADYASSLRNPTYNAQDMVFSDGDGSQITDLGDPASTGVASGLQATVSIAV